MMRSDKSAVKSFNNLPSLVDANTMLVSEGKLQLALQTLQPLFIKHQMQNYWGISLLHRHWHIESDEIALQKRREKGLRTELIMRPSKDPSTEIYPSNFFLVESRPYLLPFEYSCDEHARVANEMLRMAPDFIPDLLHAFSLCDFFDTFGLIVVRDASRTDLEFVEYTFPNRVSVVREMVKDYRNKDKLVETAWGFSSSNVAMACKSKCFETKDHPQYHDPNS